MAGCEDELRRCAGAGLAACIGAGAWLGEKMSGGAEGRIVGTHAFDGALQALGGSCNTQCATAWELRQQPGTSAPC